MSQLLTLRKGRLLSGLLCTRISRTLLALTASLLVVMPWTEYFCSFDQFLRGGQDTELGLLAVLTVLCLMLVLFQSGRTVLPSLLSLLQWLAALYHQGKPRLSRVQTALPADRPGVPSLSFCFADSFLIQLQI